METGGDELGRLQLLLKAQDQTAKQLRSDLAQRSTKVRELEAQLTKARDIATRPLGAAEISHISALEAALSSYQSRLHEMQQSLSWKITAPLRALSKPFVKG